MAVLTHAGTGTVRMWPPLPTKSTITQRSSLCWRFSSLRSRRRSIYWIPGALLHLESAKSSGLNDTPFACARYLIVDPLGRCDFASSLAPGVTSKTGQIEVESMLEICARRLKATRCRVTFAALRPGGRYEKDATEGSICRVGSELGGGIRPGRDDENRHRHLHQRRRKRSCQQE